MSRMFGSRQWWLRVKTPPENEEVTDGEGEGEGESMRMRNKREGGGVGGHKPSQVPGLISC